MQMGIPPGRRHTDKVYPHVMSRLPFVWDEDSDEPTLRARIGRTKALFAPPPWPPAAGSGSSRAAMAASSASSQSPTAVAHSKASRGCAAAWTYGSGARRGVAQGFPGARVSRRPVGDSLGGTIAHGMARRTELQDPAAARTSLTRPRVTPWV